MAEETTHVDLSIAPVESTPQVEAPVESSPEVSALRQAAYTAGYTPEQLSEYTDDGELARDLFSIAGEWGNSRALAEVGKKFAPYVEKMDDFDRWLKEQEAAAKAAEPAEPEGFQWQAPEYDEAWERVSEGEDPLGSTRAKLQRYKQFEQETLRKFVRAPHELVSQAVEPVLSQREKALREYVDQKLVEQRQTWEQEQFQAAERQQEQAWLRENMAEMYALDAKGQLTYGRDGKVQMTEYGSKAWQAYDWARGLRGEDGHPLSVREAAELAMLRVQKPGKPAQSVPEERPFLETVSAAERHPERRPMDETAPTGHYADLEESFLQTARRAMAETGERL